MSTCPVCNRPVDQLVESLGLLMVWPCRHWICEEWGGRMPATLLVPPRWRKAAA